MGINSALNVCLKRLDELYSIMYNDVHYAREGLQMKTVTFTEFRQHASELFSDVEKGEALLVLRHGKPIAEISPVSAERSARPSWKRAGLRLTAKGASLSLAILEERRRENVL